MADNPSIDPGTNPTIPVAGDDVGGAVYQRIKLRAADDGVAGSDASAANPFPMVDTALGTLAGAVTEAAPGSDTASSGLNGRLQRVAQRLTSLLALLPASLGQKTSAASMAVVVASDQSAVSVSAASLPLPTGAALDTSVTAHNALLGAVNEGTPASDTASSGLNGRLQRIAQRLTSLIALVPGSLGQKTMANGFAVTIASDQSAVPSSSAAASQVDGHSANIGALGDAASASTLTGLLKNIKAALAGTLAISQATPIHSTTVTQTVVACSASSQTLLSSNTNAKQRTIVNDSASIGYLRFNASVATTANFSIKMQPGQTYEFNPVLYDGEIRAISDTATGNWRISEWT